MEALTRDRRALTAAALTVATAVTAVLVGAAGLVAGGSGSARAAGGAVVLDEGEPVLTPRTDGGGLQLQIDDRSGDTTVVREPSDVVLYAPQSTLQYTPNPVAVALGTTDQDTWQLGGWEAENLFAPEPGWNGTEAGGPTEVTLSKYEGPGDFGMVTYTRETDWSDGAPEIHLGSTASAPHTFTLPAEQQRLSPIWMFTSEGVHRLTFTVTAGGATDTETLAVVVGDDIDPAEVLPGDGATPSSTPPTTQPPTDGATTPSPSAPSTPSAHVIADGHVDLAARPVDGELRFQIKEGTSQSYQWYEPDEVVLHVKPAAKRRITAEYAFLGEAGDPVWWLPLQQVDGLVWPGWSTEEYAKADIDGDITYRLDEVRGPGAVAVFNSGSLGAVDVRLNSGDGLPDGLAHSVHAHSHWNWTFTAEGVYRTTFTVSATLADGRKVGDTATLAWVVGDDTDPSTVTPGAGAGDEPTATPTTTSTTTPTATASATASAAPSPSSSPSPPAQASGAASPGTAGTGGAAMDGTAGSTGSSLGATPSGGLAATGTGAAVLAGLATAALLAGGGTVLAVRRRWRAR
ncbi:hypothetical protein GCM10010129_41590 [Streptomyces fumigatiscleroticus]|nr:hypothetical protein GCM10010129_41590 [Streptomyces fumigatiscleroticus]